MYRNKRHKSKEIIYHEYVLTEELREVLKEPLGLLISNDNLTYEEIKRHIGKSEMIITVGDATTERLIQLGIIPSIQIVDGKEMRVKRALPLSSVEDLIRAQNPAGHISKEALMALSSAIKAKKPVRVVIDGEEDLLTLPSVALSPDGTTVLYGQPKKGIVIIKVNRVSKRKAISYMNKMIVKDFY
ncbi:MAG: GTP-dependent dephospho-CoA kinase family protein [Nitrososphaerales archaeon]